MMRKICVVTGSRAEFGLLSLLIKDIQDDPEVELQLIATGMHLSLSHGMTFREIEQSGFQINRKVDMFLTSDAPIEITKSIGQGLIGFADAYYSLKPDLIVMLGDRFELIAAATAALIAGIPVAHIHGGETTEGALDDVIRHSVTKMSHLHFVAAEKYAQRVIQLGEHPDRVYLVGGLGVDVINRTNFLSRDELESDLNFKFGKKNLLITFHPITLGSMSSQSQANALLAALDEFDDTNLLFTMPNSDAGSGDLAAMIENFVGSHPNAWSFTSMGYLRYLSCMQFVDGVIGNSSSGLIEAPSMGIATVNIGDRQSGRLSSSSVINCPPVCDKIREAINRIYDPVFEDIVANSINPYGNGGASQKILQIIKHFPLEGLLKKSFYDITDDCE